MPLAYQEIFAEGYNPPEDHGPFVHIVFWVKRGGRKVEVARIAVPRALAYGYRAKEQEPCPQLHS